MFTKTSGARPSLRCGPGLTKQSHRGECDVNQIMRRYEQTGLMRFVESRQAQYMDAPAIDFQEAMNAVLEANSMFAEMPSDLRKRFSNDPGEFLDFASNPENIDELRDLGLAQRIPEPSPTPSPEDKKSEQAKKE